MIMRRVGRAVLFGAAVLLVGAATAEARTNRALLVAVTAYPSLPPKTALIGPNHDAALVRDYLTTAAPVKFEPNDVTLLADGLDGASASPTHAHIIDALTGLANKAEQGDFVYIHLSGHGAQQPALKAGDETDGLDEIFLPSDTATWENREQGVPNALMDNEIGTALDAIRSKGAFVWVVFDACHSGTATREIVSADEMVERKIEWDTLGIPQAEMAAAEGAGSARGMDGEAERQAPFKVAEKLESEPSPKAQPTSAKSIPKGGMVAFFAAQTVETTPEMPLPKGQADATRYGLFTYTIFSRMAENPTMTYRQLGAAVLQQYAASGMTKPTPLFEGVLDARVFGTEPQPALLQWPIEVKDNAASIRAGLLQRLNPGTRLAILPSPASPIEDALGYLEVKSAKNLSARLAPVAYDNKPVVKLADLPPNPYARVAELAVDFKLAVAKPAIRPGLEAAAAEAGKAIDTALADTNRRFNIALVEPGAPADLRLAVLPESEVAPGASDAPALFFLPPSGAIEQGTANRPPMVAIKADDPDKLVKGVADNLTTIFRATSLSRLAAASDYRVDEVSVAFQLKGSGSESLTALDASTVPVAHPEDQIWIDAGNDSTKPVDLNVLYVGSDYSITHIVAERLQPGARLQQGLLQFTDSSFGAERMIAVLTEATPQSELMDLSFLAQGGVPRVTRGVGEAAGGFADILNDIGLAPATRSAMKLSNKSGPKGAVMVYSLETRPGG